MMRRAQSKLQRKTRGFTLVELLAAMVLLALLAGVLFGSVRYADRATTASNDLVERTEQFARAQNFLREHLGGALPLRWRREPSQPLKFTGDSDQVTYLAPVASQIATGGVMWWRLGLRNNGDNRQLVLYRLEQDPELKSIPNVSTGEAVVLADHIGSLRLSYFDAGDSPAQNPGSGNWLDSWSENARMPYLLRMQVTEADGKEWPDLVVPFMLTQALGCAFDYRLQRCNIQMGGGQQ